MKNVKALALLLFAAVLGLAAAVYANNWVGQRAQIAANKVVVATVDIPAGSRLEPEMLTTIDWPTTALPPGAVADPAVLKSRVVKLDMVRGEAIIDGKLAPVGTMGGLSAVIAEGKRAMTVRVNDVVGVAGFALPGNYVDILVHAQRDEGKETKPISKTVLEHVLVLAVAQEAGRDDTKPKVVNAVTLELSLADSEKLDLARSIGTLSLALRNQSDEATVSTAGITRNELLGEVKVFKAAAPVKLAVRKPRPQPAKPSNCVEVIEMPDGSSRLSCFN